VRQTPNGLGLRSECAGQSLDQRASPQTLSTTQAHQKAEDGATGLVQTWQPLRRNGQKSQGPTVFVVESDGELVKETRLPAPEPAFRRNTASLPACGAATEAGTRSRGPSRLSSDLVPNPRRLRLIFEDSRQADDTDTQPRTRPARLDP